MREGAPQTIKKIPAAVAASEEAKQFLKEAPGAAKPIDTSQPEIAQQVRKVMTGIWKAASDCQNMPVKQHEETIAGVPCRLFTPEKTETNSQAIIYLHGGAYIAGSAEGNASPAINLADKSGRVIISVDYRLAPEAPFPAALDDSVAVYKELLNTYPASQLSIFGDSAGGGLALSLVLKLRELGEPLPAAIGLASPWTDLTQSGDSHQVLNHHCDPALSVEGLANSAKAYAGTYPADHPLISPLFADLTGLPPMLIHVGTREVLLSDATRLARKARKAGVDVTIDVYEAMWHVWHFYPGVPEADEAIVEMSEFLCKYMAD